MKQKLRTMLDYRLPGLSGIFLLFSLTFFIVPISGWAMDKSDNGKPIENAEASQLFQAATIMVKGKVVDEAGEAVPGVNILQKGTANGVITNFDGEFAIEVPPTATLIFSFIGFKTQEVQVAGKTLLNIVLTSETLGLDEVVVTAMGIKAEKKKLNFAVQTVGSDDLTAGKQTNFVDALQGRIAGVEISGTGGSPSASTQMLIRGVSSINPGQSNEPIFILNGMHVSGGASKAAEINPNDIENITVLKGAAAAALYGMEAANGAIIVTTKSGTEGEVKVSLSTTLQVEQAYRAPEIQNRYLRGGDGVYREESMGGWGPLAPEGTTTYDNVENFLQNGIYQKYDLSVSGGSKNFNSYASFNYSDHSGVVPNDYLDRWGGLVKSNYSPSDKVSMTFMANIVQRKSRGFGSNMGSVYIWPIDDDITRYKNPDGSIRRPYIREDNIRNSPISPLWSRYEDTGLSESTRTLLQSTITYDITNSLAVTGRIGYDLTHSESHSVTTPRFTLEDLKVPEGEQPKPEDFDYLGSYYYNDGKSSVLNSGVMATYNLKLTTDLTMDVLVGFDAKTDIGRSIKMGGRQFNVDEWESINNLLDVTKENIGMNRSEKNMYAYYGELKFDYRGLAQLGATFRNDHTSTLAKDNRSFYYPSFSGGLIFSELLNIQSSIFNYGKIQGNWAKVGKDAPLYRLHKWFRTLPLPDGGYGVDPTRSSNPTLKPEMTTSWEIGLDTRFFSDRTKLEFAYYSTKVEDQIVDVRVSPASGNIQQSRNEGTITNKGIEVVWTQNVFKNRLFKWDLVTNVSRNQGKVSYLPEGIVELYAYEGRHGSIAASSYLGGSTMALSGTKYQKNENGDILVRENGTPIVDANVSLIGNREADFSMGILNRFEYKRWSLAMMINIRKGGDVGNITLRNLMSNGQAKLLEDYRNREILVKGVVEQPDGSFLPNTTPVVFDQTFYNNYVATVGTNFVEDGSFVRLGYVTLGYDLSKYVANTPIKGLNLSVTGRNLLLLTAYKGSDPVVNYTGTTRGAGTFGIDYNNLPPTRSISFSLNANF